MTTRVASEKSWSSCRLLRSMQSKRSVSKRRHLVEIYLGAPPEHCRWGSVWHVPFSIEEQLQDPITFWKVDQNLDGGDELVAVPVHFVNLQTRNRRWRSVVRVDSLPVHRFLAVTHSVRDIPVVNSMKRSSADEIRVVELPKSLARVDLVSSETINLHSSSRPPRDF